MSVITGQGVTAYPLPDEELSPTSKNAVSNEAVCEGLDEIKNTLNHKADMIYDTASGDIASFPDGADGLPVKDLTVGIEPVQSGTGDPSPTNVRPISGWTGCNVTRTGVNAWDEETQAGYYIIDTGQYVANPGQLCSKNFTPVKPNMQYLFRKTHNLGDILYYSLSKELIGSAINRSANYVFTTPENCYFIKMNLGSNYGSTYNHDIGINYPSTDTAYHAYTGVTLPISWQSSAGTVYGGTLDVTSGVLTVTMASIAMDSISWSTLTIGSVNAFEGNLGNDNVRGNNAKDDSYFCTCYKYICDNRAVLENNNCAFTPFNQTTSYKLALRDDRFSTAEALTTALAGEMLVYELKTPVIIQIDHVTVNTLLGQNNVWSDTGAVLNCEYPCDTKLYIERLTAPEEDDMIANQNIASGVYFMVGNNLYLSTAAILAGDPIKPGTNCTLTNLAAALNALNS